MTIDEAIAKYKDITNTDTNCPAHCNISCDKCVKESRQLTEWLEELKMYKSLSPRELVSEKQKNDRAIEYSKGFNYGFNTGYNKAIDDFAKLVETWCWKHEQYNQDDLNKLIDIAEQLKVGASNGTDNQ